jgi:2-keto-4-pentenoate hydratase/2-oxohepta-3-ene-1,7-dioic acid hydratase in catechol pathway
MRLATVSVGGGSRAAIVDETGTAALLPFPTAREAIESAGAAPLSLRELVTQTVQSDEFTLLPPLPRPGKILGSGINYASHKDENPNAVMPTEPGFFSKFPSSVTGPDTDVVLPGPESQVDYEVELAIVIGRRGKDISRADAYSHVFGYTLINDISARDVQFRPNQMDLGKGFDTFCPMGPWIVTADSIPDVDAVTVRSWVNGDLRQDSSTAEWIYDVPALLEHASRHLTLEIGDVITTGTPAGCGTFRNPPLWLRDGDDVVIEASGVGRLRNRVVRGWELVE